MDIDEGKDYEGTYTCGGKDHGKDVDKNEEDRYGSAWSEDMIVGTDGFLVGKDDSAKLNDAV